MEYPKAFGGADHYLQTLVVIFSEFDVILKPPSLDDALCRSEWFVAVCGMAQPLLVIRRRFQPKHCWRHGGRVCAKHMQKVLAWKLQVVSGPSILSSGKYMSPYRVSYSIQYPYTVPTSASVRRDRNHGVLSTQNSSAPGHTDHVRQGTEASSGAT